MPEWAMLLLSAGIGASGGWLSAFLTSKQQTTSRIERMENHNRALWLYTRQLIDHIYQGKPPPPPEPPQTVVDMNTEVTK